MKNLYFSQFLKQFLLFWTGAVGYYSLEVIFRGFSHFSMAICGGICFLFIYFIFERYPHMNRVKKCLLGAAFITLAELITGCIVNLALGLNVWSYYHMPLNLLGQICLPFSVLWFLLCFPLLYLCGIFKDKVFSSPMFQIIDK